MADRSRIRVTPAEEEDIVIFAGEVRESQQEVPKEASSMEVTTVEEAVVSEALTSEEAVDETPRDRADAYQATTLEDLERTRMSSMQKAIIALAIVAVLAFIIWYVLLR